MKGIGEQRMATVVPYRVLAKLNVPEWLPVDVNSWPLSPVPVPPPQPWSTLLVGIEYAGPSVTVLHVDSTIHLPYDRALAQEWDTKRLGHVVLPPERAGDLPVMRDVACELIWAVYPTVVRLAAATGKSSFLSAFVEVPYRDLVAQARVEVDGQDLEIKPMAVKTSGPKAQKLGLDSQRLQAVLGRETHRYEYFLAQADVHRDRRDTGTAVAWLATTLEVASYEFLGRVLNKKHFKPKLYLGSDYPNARGRGSLLQLDPICYAACHELWGARNEVIHNGRMQVRVYDPSTEDVDKIEVRPLTADDLAEFRRAIETATIWLEGER